jgi:hypothetical protein
MGGSSRVTEFNDGAIYNITENKWIREIDFDDEFEIEGRARHTCVLYGTKLVVWGGQVDGLAERKAKGAIYDIVTKK